MRGFSWKWALWMGVAPLFIFVLVVFLLSVQIDPTPEKIVVLLAGCGFHGFVWGLFKSVPSRPIRSRRVQVVNDIRSRGPNRTLSRVDDDHFVTTNAALWASSSFSGGSGGDCGGGDGGGGF